MKLTMIIMTVVLTQAAASGLAQKITFIQKDASLKTVFREITRQTGYQVICDGNLVKDAPKINAEFRKATIQEVLNAFFTDQKVEWTIQEDIVIVKRASGKEAIKIPDPVHITGKVVDENGESLPGVSVRIKGTSVATSTTVDGKFKLESADRNVILIFTFVGYTTKEISFSGQPSLSVQMLPEKKALEEVVVVGYGTQKKKDVIAAVSSVKGKDIENQPVATPQSLIQGRAAGVQIVQNSGAPGSAVTVRVRGTTSINAGNDPLYIVDGVPVESGTLNGIGLSGSKTSALSAINADDIESMEVLKDAGALAIYGSRAANGVILITTKRGKKGATSYSFNYYRGIQSDNKNTRVDLMNSQQALELVQEGRANALNNGVSSVYGWILPDSLGNLYNTDWQDALFKTAAVSNYEMAIRGGENKLRFSLSGSYLDQDGIMINSGYKRGTGRLNLDYDASSKLKLGTNLALSRYKNNRVSTEDGDRSLIQVALKKSPSMPIYNADGTYYNSDVSGFINPVNWANKVKYENEVSSVTGNIYGEYTFIPRLVFRTTFGLNYASVLDNFFQPSDAVRNGTASGQTFSSNVTGWVNENTLNYSFNISRHQVSALLGYSQQERSSFAIRAEGKDYATNNISTLNAAVTPTAANSSESASGLSSTFARLGYSYADKYLFELTARRDGSSRFGANRRYVLFPAISGAWRISKESFWKESSLVNDLKLRGSAGKTGNQDIEDYIAQGQYATTGSYIGQSGIYMSIIPNPDLTWETTVQYNGGLDISLFNSRITLSADAYVKKTSNLLLKVELPNTSGFSNVLKNIGSTENKGLEFNLNTINIDKKDFSWSTNFNLSLNRNKVTKLNDGVSNILVGSGQGLSGSLVSYSIIQVGKPIGSLYGWRQSGVYQYSSDNTTNKTTSSVGINGYVFRGGDLNFEDVNGNNTIDDNDRMIIGNAQPDFTGGFSNNLKYKSFDLNFLMTFSYGNDMVNGTRYSAESATGFNGSLALLRRWRNEGDVTDMPKVNYADPAGNRRFSNRWIEDGSYLRLKTITLGYSLPSGLATRLKVRSCRMYVMAQNVFTITNYTGYDPEASAFNDNVARIGIDQGTYPQYRSLTFGINVGF
ncbi:SusC/RagA family TonB-linked outer membrane protein [Pararcticibacter amylolyticus]|nr:SusC/RagA family TonB-linked outer membrane protein [Pararcticibacter amylolyticus]